VNGGNAGTAFVPGQGTTSQTDAITILVTPLKLSVLATASSQNTQQIVLTSGSTFNIQSTGTYILEAIGGGAGGSNGGAGSGGGGGAYAKKTVTLSAGKVLNFAIGAGGAGGPESSAGANGSAGTATWAGLGTSQATALIVAAGGSAGTGATGGAGGSGS